MFALRLDVKSTETSEAAVKLFILNVKKHWKVL